MCTFEFLTEGVTPELVKAFNSAFGDYVVQVESAESWLASRCRKNRVSWDHSVGVRSGNRLVGFTLIGRGDWEGTPAAFDAATGIIPEFRARGLARRMFDHAVPRLQTAGVRKFLLEVMQANEPAIKAYERTGFEITREFDCFLLSTENPPRTLEEGREFEIRPAERTLLKGFVGDFEWTPSWENSPEAVTLVPEDLVAYGAFEEKECLGMVIYYPLLRWIMSLIVKPGHRRKGVGSALVGHLLRETGDLPPAIKLNNVDRSDTGMRAFLELLGFELYASQFEMMRGL